MRVEHNHNLSLDETRARVSKFGEYLTTNGIKFSWLNDKQAKVSGKYIIVNIEAMITLNQNSVVIEGNDPGVLWRSKARDFLKEKIAQYLS